MSTRVVWSADPFMRDVYLDPADRAMVAALLTRHQADDLTEAAYLLRDVQACAEYDRTRWEVPK